MVYVAWHNIPGPQTSLRVLGEMGFCKYGVSAAPAWSPSAALVSQYTRAGVSATYRQTLEAAKTPQFQKGPVGTMQSGTKSCMLLGRGSNGNAAP